MSENAVPVMDLQQIMKLLPHRYPMLLIDRVLEIEPKQRIVCLKNVTANEPQFTGHFPDYPLMPGVLIVEAMAQAGGALLLQEYPDRDNMLMVFTGIDGAKFRRPVTPGDQLRIEVTVVNWRSRAVKMRGEVKVDGRLVAEAIVTCQIVPRPGSGNSSGNREQGTGNSGSSSAGESKPVQDAASLPEAAV